MWYWSFLGGLALGFFVGLLLISLLTVGRENEELAAQKDLTATWSQAARFMGSLCRLRRQGHCLAWCPGAIVCNLEGLKILPGPGPREVL